MRRLALALVLAAAAAPAGAECVNPTGAGGCYTTIQAAVTAAAAGHVIVVSPGVYFENVTIPAGKDGLVLRGRGRDTREITILDPDAPNTGTGITVQSPGVKISYLNIRNGVASAVYVDAANVSVSDNLILSPETYGVELSSAATNARVLRNRIRSVGNMAIYSDADKVQVRGNLIDICDDGCVEMYGDDLLVQFNVITQSEDDDCIYVDGDRPQILSNTLRGCDGDGIESTGADPKITGNVIRAAGGIDADCDPCTSGLIASNDIVGLAEDEGGLDLYADVAGLVVASNSVANAMDEGVYISGTGIVFRDNVVLSNGGDNYEPGLEVYGTGHTVLRNRAIGNADQGFYVSCSGCTVEGNVASQNMSDGFEIVGTGNTVKGNSATSNAGEGFEAGGTTQTFIGNVARRNRYDYCEDTTGHTLSGNSFGTTGACAIDN